MIAVKLFLKQEKLTDLITLMFFPQKRRKTVQIVNFLSNANDRGLHLPFPRLVGSNIFFQSDSIYFLQYSKQILNLFLTILKAYFIFFLNQLYFVLCTQIMSNKRSYNLINNIMLFIIPGEKHFINFLLAARQWAAQLPLLRSIFLRTTFFLHLHDEDSSL